jgi:hypothetical protein
MVAPHWLVESKISKANTRAIDNRATFCVEYTYASYPNASYLYILLT